MKRWLAWSAGLLAAGAGVWWFMRGQTKPALEAEPSYAMPVYEAISRVPHELVRVQGTYIGMAGSCGGSTPPTRSTWALEGLGGPGASFVICMWVVGPVPDVTVGSTVIVNGKIVVREREGWGGSNLSYIEGRVVETVKAA